MSQIVVFVLDVSRGEPAQGIPVTLQNRTTENTWRTMAAGITDETGCIQGFVPEKLVLPVGHYQLLYETMEYFAQQSVSSLYPEIVVQFYLGSDKRHVLPLLLAPYGYTTYRGS